MKYRLAILILLSIALASCKSSGGHCDAYGNKAALK